jgi:hypothetical protein
MPWLGNLTQVRVNATLVFVGAFVVIALVKLTSLLPEKYYFRFSNLVSSTGSPFIVQPPGVTYSKLCALVEKNRTQDASFMASLHCPKVMQSGPSYGQQNEDVIYRTVFSADVEIRRKLESVFQNFALTRLTALEIDQTVSRADNLGQVVNGLESKYRTQVTEYFRKVIRRDFDAQFSALPIDGPIKADAEPKQAGVSPGSRVLVLKAHQALVPLLTRPLGNFRLEPIKKAKLDELTKHAYSRSSVIDSIAGYYSEQLADQYGIVLKDGFARAGLNDQEDRRKLDRAVLNEGMEPYLIAALVRIVPVLLFGVIVGFLFGAIEINSASIAAALGAFLLAWPVILLWDQVVRYDWQDKQQIFFAFYILYVISFFVTARLGARLGVLIRSGLTGTEARLETPARWDISGFGSKFTKDLLAAGTVNLVFYVGNAFVALAA